MSLVEMGHKWGLQPLLPSPQALTGALPIPYLSQVLSWAAGLGAGNVTYF